jgi:hypothetical protein
MSDEHMLRIDGEVVRRGTELRLYVNGQLSSACQAPQDRIFDLSNSCPLRIGFGQQAHFAGAIADVRLYSRALEVDEVRQN